MCQWYVKTKYKLLKSLYFEYKMPVDQVIGQIEQNKNGEGWDTNTVLI